VAARGNSGSKSNVQSQQPFSAVPNKDRHTMTIRLVIFDIDGTILQTYSWQYLHENLGTWNRASEHRSQFFANEITYEEWARFDAALWKNQPITEINRIIDRMPYTRGAKETITALKQMGIKIYLLSAGLTQVAERLQREISVDGYTANNLIIRNGYLTGEVEVNVPFQSKDRHLPHILREFNLKPERCAAVGDDPTLVPLFKKVTLAVAFNPTDRIVEEHANVVIRSEDLRRIVHPILNWSKGN